MKIPKIAIVGRVNVGKSTLFNRFVERNKALVSAIPGTTRDRNEADCLWRGKVIRLVDTGGLDVDQTEIIDRETVKQSHKAIEEADIVLFVIDAKVGPLPQEHEMAKKFQKLKKPVLLVGNKVESAEQRTAVLSKEWRLASLPALIPVSALRGTGTGDLLDIIYEELEKLKKPAVDITDLKATRVAVIGKPNAGKSSLLNAFLGEERFITSPVAHTTREPNDTLVEVKGKKYLLIDTAGMRKVGAVRKAKGLEAAGVKRTIQALKRADIVLFVLDASEPLTGQDKALAGLVSDSRAGVVFVANKWDLVKEKETNTMNDFKDYITGSIPFVKWAPTIFVSALTTKHVPKIFPIIDKVEQARFTEVPQEELDQFLQNAIRKHLPSKGTGPKPPKIVGFRQEGVAPPRFILTIRGSYKSALHPSYVRYLENRLREQFNFDGTPIFIFKKGTKSRAK